MMPLSVYIHIPFCVRKCNYCDFLSAPATKAARADYITTLKKEIMQESLQYGQYSVHTVFVGGGTPSLLDGEELADLMETLRGSFHLEQDAEITIECNPKTADETKLKELRQAGFNRLSIGLQSANDDELRLLGRVHTYRDFALAYEQARSAGFANINIDLMSALPGQTLESWERTLRTVLELTPEHISAYSLIVEEGTPLACDLAQYPPLPDEDEDRMMYARTKELLADYGYGRYEISNYAREGYECRHNITYWTRGDYVGLGLGASSMVADCRWKNTDDMTRYLRGGDVKENMQQLTGNECMEETMYLGLRMMHGVSEDTFFQKNHRQLDDVYGDVIAKWIRRGYLVRENGYVRLTDCGIDVSNVILADFLLD